MVDITTLRTFSLLVSAAVIDGRLADPERQLLHRKATEMDVPVAVLNDLLAKAEQGKLVAPLPNSVQGRQELLDDLIDIVCADGRVEPPEHHLLAKFGGHMGVELADLRARIKARMGQRGEKRGKAATPPPAPEPARAEIAPAPSLLSNPVPEIPPVTLQLLKQAILFEREPDALRYVERMMNVDRPEARKIVQRILSAFPDLKPGRS